MFGVMGSPRFVGLRCASRVCGRSGRVCFSDYDKSVRLEQGSLQLLNTVLIGTLRLTMSLMPFRVCVVHLLFMVGRLHAFFGFP